VRDLGYFGPGSVTWKVSLGPTILPALAATGLMFDLNPAMAVLGDGSETYADPVGRARRTLEYVYSVSLGDTATAQRAAKHVNAIHDRTNGTWAVTGREYHASDPENLLWLLVPWMQTQMDAYDLYGPRKLTPAQRDQMWRENVVTAELNRIPARLYPHNQAEADDYFAMMRPELALTEQGSRLVRALLAAPWDSELVAAPLVPLYRALTQSAVPLLPDYMLRIIGAGRSPRANKAAAAMLRPLFRALDQPPTRDMVANVMGGQCRELVRTARAAQRQAAASGAVTPAHARKGSASRQTRPGWLGPLLDAVARSTEGPGWLCTRHGARFGVDGSVVDGVGLVDEPLPARLFGCGPAPDRSSGPGRGFESTPGRP
jgi:uncharacterized protein (DUF2236 family)